MTTRERERERERGVGVGRREVLARRLARPEMHVRRTAKYSFRAAWVWPDDVADWFRAQLTSITAPVARPVVHVCCGASRIGDIRADLSHEGANMKADALHLPFRDESVRTIVTDPPYPWGPAERMRFGTELARIAAPDALLLWNAPWLPAEGHWWFEELYLANRRVGMPSDARPLLRARRRPRGAPA
jgi:hypothetical protein